MNDKEKIELINGIIDYWEEDTCILSYHNRYNHNY